MERQDEAVRAAERALCDVCGEAAPPNTAPAQLGVLAASWDERSQHAGLEYQVHLCEQCFFSTLATLRRERMVYRMFDAPSEESSAQETEFGLVSQDNPSQ